jgi:hypothetical protein
MLRISVVESPRRCRLVVEGKLIGPWTAELAAACDEAGADLHGRELVVDLRGAREGQVPLWRVHAGSVEKNRVNFPLTVLTAASALSPSCLPYQSLTRSWALAPDMRSRKRNLEGGYPDQSD